MSLWVRSRRYANRRIRVGRLLVVFHGELAELPDVAVRERDWMLAHLPDVTAVEAPGVGAVVEPAPAASSPAERESAEAEVASEPAAGAEDDVPRRPRGAGRKGR